MMIVASTFPPTSERRCGAGPTKNNIVNGIDVMIVTANYGTGSPEERIHLFQKSPEEPKIRQRKVSK